MGSTRRWLPAVPASTAWRRRCIGLHALQRLNTPTGPTWTGPIFYKEGNTGLLPQVQVSIRRVILGTVAVRDPELVRAACKLFPGRIVVGIDAKGGRVATQGWAETSDLGVIELARRFEDAGVAAVIYTDIDRDGVLAGLNLPATLALARATAIPVIASGGLASMADIEALASPECAVLEGAISGRAIYDGRIDPVLALARLARCA